MESMTVGRYVPGVLVVDDEPLVRSFLRDALVESARVIEAEDGEHAIEVLRGGARDTLDLALVDHFLPKMSGLEVLRITKRNWPWLPVVLITGSGSEDLAVKAWRGGASDYLKKPIELDALLSIVSALIRRPPITPRVASSASDHHGRCRTVHPSVRRGLAFMQEHFADPITLADVARAACLSRFHFCRLFHHETGMPLHEYLHDLRVTKAKLLLRDHGLRISEVAFTVGFNDLSHFDRTFRRLVGRSPSQYRRSLLSA
jgi:YesN/AraC family two-component response regulator